MILNMKNIKIILLLSLAAYALCGGNGSPENEINTKKQTNEASDSPKQKTKAQLENELLEKAEAELKVLELNKHQNKDSGSTSLEQKSITELEFETEPQIKKPNNEDSNSAPSEQKTVAQLKIELKIAEAKLKDLELKKHKNEDFSSASLIQETIAELKNEIEIAEAKAIEDSFNDCLRWIKYTVQDKETMEIDLTHFIVYMGNNSEEIQFILLDYFEDHPNKNVHDYVTLNVERYGDFLKYVCERKIVSVEDYVKKRIDTASTKELPDFLA